MMAMPNSSSKHESADKNVVNVAKNESGTDNQKTGEESLKAALCKQIEYYFSKENLATDSYLVSQMDSQLFVPLEKIANFSKVKELSTNLEEISIAIKGSKNCCLNAEGTAVKPNIKTERNTIILREIPTDTPKEKVESLFADCGAATNVRSDVGDTWFVTMATEDEAVSTLLALRNKTFEGAPIKARLKSENKLRSLLASPVTTTSGAVGSNFGNEYYHQMNYYNGAQFSSQYHANPNGYNYGAQETGRSNGARRQSNSRGNASGRNGKEQGRKGSSSERANRKGKDKRSYKQDKKAAAAAGERQPVLNALNFPPLPAQSEKAADSDDGYGYAQEYLSYTHDEIVEIVKNMGDNECVLEDGKMDFSANAAALNSAAHPALLKNQRTYSIEQAREAMRQGRPIRSDSVGSIDYESMLFGEEYTKQARAARMNEQPAAPVAEEVLGNQTPNKQVGGATLSPASRSASKPSAIEPQQEPHPKKVGYAAALLSAPSVAPSVAPAASSAEVNSTKATGSRAKKTVTPKASKDSSTSPVVGLDESPSGSPWGAKRTFLDVLKTAEATRGEN